MNMKYYVFENQFEKYFSLRIPDSYSALVRGKVTQKIELQGNSLYCKGNEGPFTDWRHFYQQEI